LISPIHAVVQKEQEKRWRVCVGLWQREKHPSMGPEPLRRVGGLTQRREFVDLSIDELANRVGESSEWLADVEAGKTTSEVIFSQWLNLVWATRKGWPDEMRSTKSEVSGWVARQGQFLREAEISVNQMLGLYD
jgi:hypothetical protein